MPQHNFTRHGTFVSVRVYLFLLLCLCPHLPGLSFNVTGTLIDGVRPAIPSTSHWKTLDTATIIVVIVLISSCWTTDSPKFPLQHLKTRDFNSLFCNSHCWYPVKRTYQLKSFVFSLMVANVLRCFKVFTCKPHCFTLVLFHVLKQAVLRCCVLYSCIHKLYSLFLKIQILLHMLYLMFGLLFIFFIKKRRKVLSIIIYLRVRLVWWRILLH